MWRVSGTAPLQVCRSNDKFDCVTLDGEKFGRRGNISGGFAPTNRARLAVYDNLMKAREQVRQGGTLRRCCCRAAS